MTAGAEIPVSVIVVSRGRPQALRRCIAGIAQSDHPLTELIVVTDTAGRSAVAETGHDRVIKTVPFEEANIAAARNAGVRAAAGEVCAFIDDDSVPEPTWLSRLVDAFARPQVMAAGGFVRGRNGISFQWRARLVDRTGRDISLSVDPYRPSLHSPEPGRAVKTEGTNMAFRRHTLLEMGGFDPAFAFFMDETDLNMRLSAMGQLTAIVPLAQVHHGFAASARRRDDRVPLDLYDIGASTAVYLRKHAPPSRHDMALERLRRSERRRLLTHMVYGRLEPRDVPRLMRGLEHGIAAGLARRLTRFTPLSAAGLPFRQFDVVGPRPGRVIAGWSWQDRRLRGAARAAVQRGAIVTVFRFSPTTLYHQHRFHRDGYWEQTGGLWGRSDRDGPLIRPLGFAARLRVEMSRLSSLRPLDTMIH